MKVTGTRGLMTVYVILVAALTGVYLTVSGALTPVWALIGLSSVVAVLVGVRINRPAHRWPWWTLAAALLAFTAGDTYYNSLEAYYSAANPFPSPADACYLLTYPLFTAGLLGLVRHRVTERDLPGLLDALIFTAGLALPVWVFLVQPLAHVADLTWVQRATSIAYPLGDVLVLALLARLLTLGPHRNRNRAMQFLVLGTLTLLGFDIAYGILQLNGTWQAGSVLDSGWIVFYTSWGLAALHPSMTELTAGANRPQSLLPPPRRLLLLAGAVLIAPAILLYEGSSGAPRDVAVIAAFSGLLILLVILRLTGMVVVHRKAVARENALRSAVTALVAAITPRDISHACARAVAELFGPEVPHASMLLWAPGVESSEDQETRTGETPAGPPAALAIEETCLTPVDRLGPALTARLGRFRTALLCPVTEPDQPAGAERPGVLLAAGAEKRLSEMRSSLEILASHAGLAMQRMSLRREISRRENEAYFRTLVHNAADVILIVGSDDTVRYASPSARHMFGAAELVGVSLPSLVEEEDRRRAGWALAAMRNGDRCESQGHWGIQNGNNHIEAQVRFRDLRDDRTVRGLVVTLRDVTEQRQLEQELTQRAFHDSLTGLPNRTLLLERLDRALLRGGRQASVTGVLFIDLDDFKIVNDSMGHLAGDQLLVAVGSRLAETVRRTDTAARLGGDEFAVLMEDAKAPVDAELLAAQVIQTLSRPFRLPEGSVSVSASVGVATTVDSADTSELLTHADLALYAAKVAGKCQWRHFQNRLRDRMLERFELRTNLDVALNRDEFALRYQPVVDIARGEVVGFEALARWSNPRSGPVPPQQFIALAEETGHITSLGAWVLGNATSDMALLQRATPGNPPYVSVNVSARQFRDADFLDKVRGALATPGLAPGSLQLELTETVLVQRDRQIEAVMRSLKDLGVRIAVDDFGTGYSSLRYLRDFPIDVLKIDKSFIDEITSDARQMALVKGIVNIADTLGLQVIAEGIEDRGQRDLLARTGCRFGQGFLYARPMTLQQGASLLRHPSGNWHPGNGHPHADAASNRVPDTERGS